MLVGRTTRTPSFRRKCNDIPAFQCLTKASLTAPSRRVAALASRLLFCNELLSGVRMQKGGEQDMKKAIACSLFIVLFANCAIRDVTRFTVSPGCNLDSIKSIRVVEPKTRMCYRGFFIKTGVDSILSDSSNVYCDSKFQRKFGEYGINVTSDSCSDSIKSQIICFLNSLHYASDLRTILCGDSISAFMNNKPERYFIYYLHNGVVWEKYRLVIKNLPFYLLSFATLGIVNIRWTEGVSWLWWALCDKQTNKAIYYSYSRRFCIPWEETTTNKHIERTVYDLMEKGKK
jgi:hypothetical protein